MAEKFREIIGKQPLVPVLISGSVNPLLVQAVLYGLEEEGIPALTDSSAYVPLNQTTKEISQLARLNLGIGFSQSEQVAILHHRDLPTEEPLFCESLAEANPVAFRRLGANAARLVKGNPLLFEDEPEYLSTQKPQKNDQVTGDGLHQLVAQIVKEILGQMAERRQ